MSLCYTLRSVHKPGAEPTQHRSLTVLVAPEYMLMPAWSCCSLCTHPLTLRRGFWKVLVFANCCFCWIFSFYCHGNCN